jgi:predicted AAA+ superfamily ATPase
MEESWIPRRALGVVEESLAAFRVVVLHGARQTGKTTLARHYAAGHSARYVTLDHADEADAMASDPATYLSISGTPLVIDEVQRVGEPLILAVKTTVDLDNRPGQYLLTGSTNFLTVPAIAETLAGRTDIVTMWPLSQGEITGGGDGFVDRAFGDPAALLTHQGHTPSRANYFEALCVGGYPAVLHLGVRARRRWFARYVQTVLQREIEVAADIRRADALTEMVRYFAATTAQELVLSTVAQRLGIDRSTVNTYEPWLETVFLVHRLPAWSRNLTAKAVKRPKLYVTDTGIAANLLAKDAVALQRINDPAAGALFETFIVNEVAKQSTWCETPARMYHFRDSDGAEVDLLLEADDGRVVAIEFKASSTPRSDDFRWLMLLRDRLDKAGADFVAGIVLHTGTARLRFGDRMIALPAADVWT